MEKQIQDILEIVGFIKDNAAMKSDLEQFATKDDLRLLATKEDLQKVDLKVDDLALGLSDLTETVVFIKDNAVMKSDLEFVEEKINLKINIVATDLKSFRGEFEESRVESNKRFDDLMSKLDSLITLFKKNETEIAALRSKYSRLEDIVNKVLVHLKLEI